MTMRFSLIRATLALFLLIAAFDAKGAASEMETTDKGSKIVYSNVSGITSATPPLDLPQEFMDRGGMYVLYLAGAVAVTKFIAHYYKEIQSAACKIAGMTKDIGVAAAPVIASGAKKIGEAAAAGAVAVGGAVATGAQKAARGAGRLAGKAVTKALSALEQAEQKRKEAEEKKLASSKKKKEPKKKAKADTRSPEEPKSTQMDAVHTADEVMQGEGGGDTTVQAADAQHAEEVPMQPQLQQGQEVQVTA